MTLCSQDRGSLANRLGSSCLSATRCRCRPRSLRSARVRRTGRRTCIRRPLTPLMLDSPLPADEGGLQAREQRVYRDHQTPKLVFGVGHGQSLGEIALAHLAGGAGYKGPPPRAGGPPRWTKRRPRRYRPPSRCRKPLEHPRPTRRFVGLAGLDHPREASRWVHRHGVDVVGEVITANTAVPEATSPELPG